MLNKTVILSVLLFVAVLLTIEAPALVDPRGTDETFDLLTWNIHEFPGTGFRTIDTLAVLVNDLDVDMIAFQEISDTNSFYQLMNLLPEWDGFFSNDDYGNGTYHKTAMIWRTDRANVTYVEALFESNWYQFPRPPIHVTGEVTFGEHQFDFHLINLHLKAGSTPDDQLRRRAGIIMLKSYLDTEVPASDDQDWIVLGDYNDELDDPEGDNVFWPLLEDSTNYTFLTMPLAGDPYWASFPTWNSLIDHIMVTSDALDEYGDGNTITLRLDDEYSNYAYRISDHRPVMSQFAGQVVSVDNDENLPEEFELLNVYPNPFNNVVNLSVKLQRSTDLKIEIYDIRGRKVQSVVNGYYDAGDHSFSIDASAWVSGVYFAKLNLDDVQTIKKLTLLK
jgi:endonuclease/exonuclease/phosphatase family metal-dependent hydrolase